MSKKKILKMIFSSFFACSLCLGLVSCGTKGDTGEKGDKGDVGEKGDKGDKGDNGLDGVDAVSAFDIAKGFGYQGNYGAFVTEVVKGTLGVQYDVLVSDDYKTFTYGWDGQTVTLSEKSILLDSRFTDSEVEAHDYIYNDIIKAVDAAKDGSADAPMTIYMAPGVYWTHDPLSESTDKAYQIEKECQYMNWVGLTDDARNVVIAFNYGHNVGYDGGNPTCFNISGDNFTISNMTIGGYCNIDLDYALNRSLNVEKRSTDVTQCQLGNYNGDKLYCNNVSFISRLNMMPFVSSKRALYVDCHMESTDDSLNGSSQAVYLNCDFDFYASKPWGGSSGVTLLNCDFNITHINVGNDPHQYLAKGAGRFNVIDCRFTDSTNKYNIGWSDILSDTYRSYYSNVTYNGVSIDFSDGGINADKGIDLTGTSALKAYKLVNSKGNVTYNVYNLLRGSDEWDPLGQKDVVTKLGGVDVATTLSATSTSYALEAGKDGSNTATITYKVTGPQSTEYTSNVTYSIDSLYADVVTLTKNADNTCTVTAINDREEAVDVIVNVTDASGLQSAVKINVKPSILEIAKATDLSVVQNADGTATVSYTISDLGGRADNSRINWYVCDDSTGTNPIHIATGRGNTPLKTITLQPAFAGKYLKVTVESKHIRSNYAEEATIISNTAITSAGIESIDTFNVDLATFVTDNNMTILPGYWMVNNASYGTGNKNGFKDYTGLYFTGNKSTTPTFSEIDYVPVSGTYNDMDVTLKVAPGKTAGQGFGSNNNFLEIRIKYDVNTGSGYALRIVRTSGDSTVVKLVALSKDASGNKVVEELATSTNTSVYLTECTIHVWTSGTKLYAHLETTATQPTTAIEKGYLASVDLEADITSNNYGGFGAYYESSTGDNTTYIGELTIKWLSE